MLSTFWIFAYFLSRVNLLILFIYYCKLIVNSYLDVDRRKQGIGILMKPA